MGDFHNTHRPKARKARACPECQSEIVAGQTYVRLAGCSDGDFYSGIMCEPCDAFGDRYLQSLRLSSCVNADEVTYQFGGLISEAAEFTGYLWEEGQDDKTPAQRRDAMLPILEEHDVGEREYQRQEREARKAAKPDYSALAKRPRYQGMASPLPAAQGGR